MEAVASQLQSLAEQDNANPPSPSAALEQFADELENMNETERQELAEALAQMAAQAAQVGDQSLAQALAAMSQATLSGDSAAASQAANDASGALAQAQQELSNQQALQQALDQLQNSSQAMAQAGQAGQQAAGQEPGQGNNPGQGQSGQGTSGGGTKADTLPPGTGSGQTGRPEDMDTGGATGEMGNKFSSPGTGEPLKVTKSASLGKIPARVKPLRARTPTHPAACPEML